jgi:hypothetical protein
MHCECQTLQYFAAIEEMAERTELASNCEERATSNGRLRTEKNLPETWPGAILLTSAKIRG